MKWWKRLRAWFSRPEPPPSPAPVVTINVDKATGGDYTVADIFVLKSLNSSLDALRRSEVRRIQHRAAQEHIVAREQLQHMEESYRRRYLAALPPTPEARAREIIIDSNPRAIGGELPVEAPEKTFVPQPLPSRRLKINKSSDKE